MRDKAWEKDAKSSKVRLIATPVAVKEGDQALLSTPSGISKAFFDKYEGPFVARSVLAGGYRVLLGRDGNGPEPPAGEVAVTRLALVPVSVWAPDGTPAEVPPPAALQEATRGWLSRLRAGHFVAFTLARNGTEKIAVGEIVDNLVRRGRLVVTLLAKEARENTT